MAEAVAVATAEAAAALAAAAADLAEETAKAAAEAIAAKELRASATAKAAAFAAASHFKDTWQDNVVEFELSEVVDRGVVVVDMEEVVVPEIVVDVVDSLDALMKGHAATIISA